MYYFFPFCGYFGCFIIFETVQCEPGGRELTQREEEEGGSQAAGAEVVLDVSPAVGAAHPASTEVRQLGSGQVRIFIVCWAES